MVFLYPTTSERTGDLLSPIYGLNSGKTRRAILGVIFMSGMTLIYIYMQRFGHLDELGQKGDKMKKIEMKRRKLPLNLQFFAGDDDGAEGGNGGGDDAKDTTGTEGETTPPTFDDLLRGGHQAEFDRRTQKAITTALDNQRSKYETLMDDKVTEAEKLAKMNKDEKEAYLRQKKEKELAERESAITRKELMAEAKNTLAGKKLPVSLAEVLNYTDADTCSKSIEAVESAFNEALESAVEERLKGGKPPKKAPAKDDGDASATTFVNVIKENQSKR